MISPLKIIAHCVYRAEKKSLQILLSRIQAGLGRKVKQEQEQTSRNQVQRLFLISVRTANSPFCDLVGSHLPVLGTNCIVFLGDSKMSDADVGYFFAPQTLLPHFSEFIFPSPSANFFHLKFSRI